MAAGDGDGPDRRGTFPEDLRRPRPSTHRRRPHTASPQSLRRHGGLRRTAARRHRVQPPTGHPLQVRLRQSEAPPLLAIAVVFFFLFSCHFFLLIFAPPPSLWIEAGRGYLQQEEVQIPTRREDLHDLDVRMVQDKSPADGGKVLEGDLRSRSRA